MDDADIARTEAAFREVNEAIAKTAARFDAEETDFICECADPGCADRMTVELEDYEEVRSEPTRFLLAPGHHEPAVEQIVAREDDFEIVDKVAPDAATVARALNPRAA
ncbi:MAG: hypothetical protein HOQ28_04155 [Thermoleophilia bacterium]|nr:hypothetical protein [Thermoleophilia bacterium]